jgi:hypothetical protein
MKPVTLALSIAVALAGAPAFSQVSVGIGLPSVSIGINVPAFPTLTVIPGYPVYYAPSVDGNLFFYDGLYWSLNADHWYSSRWYNGPWDFVAPEAVPDYLWRVPVRYYRRPPPYFRGWRADEVPHWGEHWGPGWQAQHHGWDHWDRHAGPPPAPLPTYQREYRGERYPRPEQQADVHRQNYQYQHQDPVVRQRMEGEQRHAPEGRPEPGREHEHEHEHDRDH